MLTTDQRAIVRQMICEGFFSRIFTPARPGTQPSPMTPEMFERVAGIEDAQMTDYIAAYRVEKRTHIDRQLENLGDALKNLHAAKDALG